MLRAQFTRIVRLGAVVALVCACTAATGSAAAAVQLPAGFQQSTAISGLASPTDLEIAADGRVFVAEKSGILKTWSSLSDTSATVLADLRTQVHNYSNRGLLGLAVDPAFPASPYVYVFYTVDAPIGGTPPVFGKPGWNQDSCPGATDVVNCVVSARVSRLRVNGEQLDGPEQVLVNDWCQQFGFHAGGGIEFGADGYLYVSAGEGARWGTWDYGQLGNPTNVCADPPGGAVGDAMTPPTAEGGRLRSQDLRTSGDPLGLGGTLIRIDPATGAGAPGNPRATGADPNERRVLAYGLRNAARLAVRPGTNDVWLGDWGAGYWEEIDRVPQPTDPVRNFGWPCYEGGLDANGVPYTRIRPRSDDQDLAICEDLYAEGTATSAPYYAYDHELEIVPGENCSIDDGANEPGGKIWALNFYPATGAFPPAYRGALFFGDELRECMWAMLPGEDGLPDREHVVNFAQAAASPLDIEPSPAGDLLWIDEDASNVKRVRWVGNPANRAPTAAADADTISGTRALTVHFDAGASTDPDSGDVLTYRWDLDGDGELDDSAARSPVFTYTARGTYTVALRVTDTSGAADTDTVTITVTSGPVATIAAPGANTQWKVGDTISFSGSAADLEDGPLPASALDWVVALRACPAAGNCHEDLIGEFHGTDIGSFTAPDRTDPASIELRLTATDSGGEQDVKAITLQPRTAQLTLDSTPAGAQVGIDGDTRTAPFAKTVVANSTSTISAPATQSIAGATHRFASWPDGQARTHTVKVPSGGALHLATFASTALGTQTLTFYPEADALVERLNPATNFGSSTRLDSDRSSSHEAESDLRFLVSGLSGTVTSARLRLRATSNTIDGPGVYATAGEWSEGGITWNDRPVPVTGVLADTGPIAAGDVVEWDVTQALAGDGPHTLRLASAINDGVSFNSREVATQANRPQLVVTFSNTGYPRPKGATPARFSLVPAYDGCTNPNRQHGPPLAHPSCSPPSQSSRTLTVGSPDANLAPASSTGFVTFEVIPGDPATSADEADVRMQVAVTDVRRRADLADYTGALQALPTLRVTDKAAGGTSTIADVALPVDAPCAATAAGAGATCSVVTTLDALYPGLVAEAARTIWQLNGVEVRDGGPDENTATPDNEVFMRPGIFVP